MIIIKSIRDIYIHLKKSKNRMFREIKNKRVLTRYYKYEAHEYTVDSFSLRNLSRYREKLINQTRYDLEI